MALSARNRLSGEVASVEKRGLVAEVVVELDGGQRVTSVVTADSVDRLGVEEGDEVETVVKATSVMLHTGE